MPSQDEADRSRAEPGRGGKWFGLGIVLLFLLGELFQIGDPARVQFLGALGASILGVLGLRSFYRQGRGLPGFLRVAALWVVFAAVHTLWISPAPYFSRLGSAQRAQHLGVLTAAASLSAMGTDPVLVGRGVAWISAVAASTAFLPGFAPEEGRLHWASSSWRKDGHRRAAGIFGNPNLLGGFLVFSILFGLGFLVSRRGIRPEILVPLGVQAAAMGASQSRSSWIALAVGILVWVGLGDRRKLRFGLGAGLLLVVVLFGGDFQSRIHSVADRREFGVGQRVEILKAGLEMAAARPLGGFGLGTFETAFPGFRRVGGQYALDAHNQGLQEQVEGGVLNALLFLGLGLALARSAWTMRGEGRLRSLSGVVAFGVYSCFASQLEYFPLALPALLCLGLDSSGEDSPVEIEEDGSAPPERADPEASGEKNSDLLAIGILGLGFALGAGIFLSAGLGEIARGRVSQGLSFLAQARLRPEAQEALLQAMGRDLDDAEAVDPGAPATAYLRGQLAQLAGELELAREAYREVLRRNPYEGLAWVGIAEVEARKENYSEALSFLEKAQRLDPMAEAVMHRRAALLARQGELEDAVRLLRRALDTNPAFLGVNSVTYPKIYRDLLGLLRRLGREQEARLLEVELGPRFEAGKIGGGRFLAPGQAP